MIDDNITGSIATISEEDLNALFNETPDSTVNADKLEGAKTDDKKDDKKDDSKKDDKTVKTDKIPDNGEVNVIDDLEALLGDETKDDSKKDDKVDDTKSDDKKDDKSKEAPKDDKKDDTDDEDVKGVLKSTVEYLIKKGQWADWDGREELEDIDEATYADIAIKQDQFRVSKMFNEMLDSTGPYGKAIINFVKEGGNPDEIIDIFKEQKEIETFDLKEEGGQKALINKYYGDVLGWKPEKINRHITSLIAANELDTESSDVKELYDKHTSAELNKINAEQQAYVAAQKEREEKFKSNITTAIKDRKDLSETDRKKLEQAILVHNNKLPNGTLVSDFYVKFAEMQADPKEYIDFVEFVTNKAKYLERQKTQIKNKVTDDTFNFVKGNTAMSKTKGSSHENVKRQESQISDFSFGFTPKR